MRAGHVSKGEQTSFSEFLQTKSLSPEAAVNAETSSRILGAELHVGYKLDGGYTVKLRAVSFYLKAKPGSAVLPECCLGEKVVGKSSRSQCKGEVCPRCQDIACHVEGGHGWWGPKLCCMIVAAQECWLALKTASGTAKGRYTKERI